MERDELLRALRGTAADQHRCFGCGYEHKCSIHGCAINRAAAELIEQLAAENEALRNPPNAPLTLEQLQEMDGEPVWAVPLAGQEYEPPESEHYMEAQWIIVRAWHWRHYNAELGDYGKTWLTYRHKPEEGTT